MNEVKRQDVLFRHPFTAIISGASMSGKTVFISEFIKNRHALVTPNVHRVVYSYKKYQPIFDTIKDVQFVKGSNYVLDKNVPTLLIIDDQADTIEGKELIDLFTVRCHHENTSLFFVTQNLFVQKPAFRTAALNAQYIIVFKSPRGASQIVHLARQLNPGKSKKIQEIYHQATSKPYSYLLIDLKPDTPETLRYRTNVLPSQGNRIVLKDGKEYQFTECFEV